MNNNFNNQTNNGFSVGLGSQVNGGISSDGLNISSLGSNFSAISNSSVNVNSNDNLSTNMDVNLSTNSNDNLNATPNINLDTN